LTLKFSAEQLRECLHCGYSLNGLPKIHVCPECGAAYDLTMPVWRPRIAWARLLPLVGLLMLLIPVTAVSTGMVLGMFLAFGQLGAFLGFLMALLAPAALLLVPIWRHRAGTYLVLQPDGLVICRSGSRSFHELSSIKAAHPEKKWPFVHVETQGSPIYLTRFFETVDEERDFWQTIRRMRVDAAALTEVTNAARGENAKIG
jgi:hypothetical protein